MHGVKPLHVRKQKMHVGRDRLRLRGETGAADNASVASSNDMSRSLDDRHKVRLYVEKAGLWNPADSVLHIHRAIDDPAGNSERNYRTETGGALDDEFAHDAGSTLAHALQTEVPLLAAMHDIGIDT